MYSKDEILSIIALGEGYNAEFKSSLPSKVRDITEEICVFGLFERISMVEQVGSGISRMKDEMKAANLPEPLFNTDVFFTVVFEKQPKKKTREKTREKILFLMGENPEITTAEMAKSIGITQKGIEYHLSNLKKDKIIKRIGGDKGGKWIVNSSKQ